MRGVAALFLVLVCAVSAGAASTSPRTELASVSWQGRSADGDSYGGALSADGRYVAFSSGARDIVRSRRIGVFIRDRRRDKTEWLGRAAGTTTALTPDARFLLVCTHDSLVRGDVYVPALKYWLNNDVYVYDTRSRKPIRASVPAWDRKRKEPTPACGADFSGEVETTPPDISSNGRFVAFGSEANNIVRGDTNRAHDLFVRDLVQRRTRRVSVSTSGTQANGSSVYPLIVRNRLVYFCSSAENLAPPRVPGRDIFVHDLRTRTTRQIVLKKRGRRVHAAQCLEAFSNDGRFVAFATVSPELVGDLENVRVHHAVQLVVKDLRSGAYDVITRGIDGKGAERPINAPLLSGDGRYVAFATEAANLVPGDKNIRNDVFWFDRVRRTTVRVSLRADGGEIDAQGGSFLSSISPDGRWVAWESKDRNVVLSEPGKDTNDVFIRGPMH